MTHDNLSDHLITLPKVQVQMPKLTSSLGLLGKQTWSLGRQNNMDTEDKVGREKEQDFYHLSPKVASCLATRL